MADRRLLEIVAGAERALGVGQDRDMLRGVGIEAAEGVGEQGAVGGLTALRAAGRSIVTIVTWPSTTQRTVGRSAMR